MNNRKYLTLSSCGSLISVLAVLLLSSCQSAKEQPQTKQAAAPAAAQKSTAATPAPAPEAATPAPTQPPVAPAAAQPPSGAAKAIRINAGSTDPYTDSAGNVWLPDQGFADGDIVDRGAGTQVANTKEPAIYRTEHWGMSSFSQKLANGKYTVKLHFAETYDGVTGPKERVFSINVGGKEIKDFDVWAKAGGFQRAYVETVNDVAVTNGKLDITFTTDVQSPEINGIEILP